jgi:hypothetical protein
MKFLAFLVYGGPDQLMPLTSGLAAIFAFLLIFWNKVLFLAGRILNAVRPGKKTMGESANRADAPTITESRSPDSDVKAGQHS